MNLIKMMSLCHRNDYPNQLHMHVSSLEYIDAHHSVLPIIFIFIYIMSKEVVIEWLFNTTHVKENPRDRK